MPKKKNPKIPRVTDAYLQASPNSVGGGAELYINPVNLNVHGEKNPYYQQLGAALNYQVNPNLNVGLGATRGSSEGNPYTNYNAALRYTFGNGGSMYPTNSALQNVSVDQISKGASSTSDLSTFNELQGLETAQSKIQKQNAMNNMTPEMVAAYQQMMQKQQMMHGGAIYAKGGDILSGAGAVLAGAGKGIAGSLLPGPLGMVANQGIDALHGALDKDITDQDKALMGYGQAAGAIGTAVATGGSSLAAGADDIAGGLSQGISSGTKWGKKNAGAVNAVGNFAGMAGGMATGNIGQAPVGQAAYDADYAKAMAAGASSFANGGLMSNGGVAEINAGGTHEQSPIGGVPQGPNALVEEGEVVADMPGKGGDMTKFAFSNRIEVEKGVTVADAAKKIKKKYKTAKGEDRYGDAAAKKAQDQELQALATKQEQIKAEKVAALQKQIEDLGGVTGADFAQNPQNPAPEMPAPGGPVPEGMAPGMDPNQMMAAMGGDILAGGGPFQPKQYGVGGPIKGDKYPNGDKIKRRDRNRINEWLELAEKQGLDINDPNVMANAPEYVQRYNKYSDTETIPDSAVKVDTKSGIDFLDSDFTKTEYRNDSTAVDPNAAVKNAQVVVDPKTVVQPTVANPTTNPAAATPAQGGTPYSFTPGQSRPSKADGTPYTDVEIYNLYDAYAKSQGKSMDEIFPQYKRDIRKDGETGAGTERFGPEHSQVFKDAQAWEQSQSGTGTNANTGNGNGNSTGNGNEPYDRSNYGGQSDGGAGYAKFLEERNAEIDQRYEDKMPGAKRNIWTGAGLSSAGDVYSLINSMRPIDELSLGRYNPELVDLERERIALRNQAATANAIGRENVRSAATSSGQQLSNLAASNAAINAQLSQGLGTSHQKEEVTNVGLQNEANKINLSQGDKETMFNLKAKGAKQTAQGEAIKGLGYKAAGALKDVRQTDAMYDLMGIQEKQLVTPDYYYGQGSNHYKGNYGNAGQASTPTTGTTDHRDLLYNDYKAGNITQDQYTTEMDNFKFSKGGVIPKSNLAALNLIPTKNKY